MESSEFTVHNETRDMENVKSHANCLVIHSKSELDVFEDTKT